MGYTLGFQTFEGYFEAKIRNRSGTCVTLAFEVRASNFVSADQCA